MCPGVIKALLKCICYISLSTDHQWPQGCFYLLAIVNKVMHIGVQTSDILLSILLSIYPKVGLLENMVISLLTWSNISLPSWIITCFHDNNVQSHRFLHIHINIYLLLKKKIRKRKEKNTSHISGCEAVSYCGFVLHFLELNWDSELETVLAQPKNDWGWGGR